MSDFNEMAESVRIVRRDIEKATLAEQLATEVVQVLSEDNVKLRTENRRLRDRVQYLEASLSQQEALAAI